MNSFKFAAIVIMDRDSGRSRGFGFVTFAKSDDAVEARKELNGKVRKTTSQFIFACLCNRIATMFCQ